jgi:4-alpha-glucanotransferase
MKFNRSSGVLLHPTSLPGPNGIGDLGPAAYQFVDFLAETGCRFWQVLPLGPTGYGDSPYQCFSAFAGNPYLVSPQVLIAEGLLTLEDLDDKPDFPPERVDYGKLIPWKLNLLEKAYHRFLQDTPSDLEVAFLTFQVEHEGWLESYARFMSLKEVHGGKPWTQWPAPLRDRQPATLRTACRKLASNIQRHKFHQFLFFRQWEALRRYTHARGIYLIGDLPIFVSHDSADVWEHPELFHLDESGKPTVVAGVPPDYFSATGQLWGNPLYRWENHAHEGYAWWLARLQNVLTLVDLIRLDHFRGFAAYWEVPANEPTAENGRWVPGPGATFFHIVKDALRESSLALNNGLPLIAEDLGEITPDVIELRDTFGLPGMKVLVFAFDSGPQNPFLPHNYTENCVVYTGTHDNDTARGWFENAPEGEKDFARRYLGCDGNNIAWDLMRAAWSSVAQIAIAPMQDLLNLDNQARMNYPGKASGNWTWRMPSDALNQELRQRLRELNTLYGRH